MTTLNPAMVSLRGPNLVNDVLSRYLVHLKQLLAHRVLCTSITAPPESKPMIVGNSFTAKTMIPKSSESAVWSFDGDTRVLSPTWVNPDGSSLSPTDVAYTDDVLVLTGCLKAFWDD